MREAECTTACVTVEEALRSVPDPRQRRGQRYAWETLLLLICAALMSGQQTGAAIAQWIAEHATEWQVWAPTPAGRVPSAATVRRAMRCVEVDKVEQALGAWAKAQVDGKPVDEESVAPPLRALALDGKAVRGAQTHGGHMRPRSIWSAWSRMRTP